MKTYNSIAVIGTTATGKTKLACHLAFELQGEVLSVDSRQVYRGMDIGTGKDLNEFVIQNNNIPHHLIDILPAGTQYNVHQFQVDFFKAWQLVLNRGKLPIICGGTPLYFATLMQDFFYTQIPVNKIFRKKIEKLNKEDLLQKLAKHPNIPYKVDTHSHKRLVRALEIVTYLSKHSFNPPQKTAEIQPLTVAIYLNTDERKKRIDQRLRDRLASGMIEEVETLIKNGLTEEQLTYYGLEYKYIVNYLNGNLSRFDFEFQLQAAIYRFSKRQLLFFKKLEREGIDIHWIDGMLSFENQLDKVKKIWNYNLEKP